jgi:ABC-type branched-subunit amino acid transport system substrate-binding protein
VDLRTIGSTTLCCALVLTGCASQVAPGDFVGDAAPTAGAVTVAGSGQLGPGGGPLGYSPGAPTAPSGKPNSAVPTQSASTPGAVGSGPGSVPAVGATGSTVGTCAGFHNQTGISDSTIDVGNVADLSGPVPGLFTAAQQAAMAFAAYFNSVASICGRKLKVVGYDSQTSAIGDQQAASSACTDTFAMVGSVSAFDSGGAKTVAQCGIPDLRTISTTPDRVASPVSYGVDAVDPTQVSTAQYRVIKSLTGDAYQHSAMLYLDAGAAVPNAMAYRTTMEQLGYKFVYTAPIDVTAFNYAPYAAKLKQLGVTLVQFEGSYQFAVRLKQALAAQGVNPVFVMDSVAYDPVFVEAGGSALNGMYSYVDSALFEEESRSPEMQLYLTWLHRIAPDAQPSFFGMFAWGAMELFSEISLALGGQLSRGNMLTAIRSVHEFTANGLFAPQDIGDKRSPNCQAVIQLEGGHWVRRSPYPYSCSDVVDTGS